MSSLELKEAVSELSKFFALNSLQELIGADIVLKSDIDNEDQSKSSIIENNISRIIDSNDPISMIGEIIVDAQKGAKFTREIIDAINLLFREQEVDDQKIEFLSRVGIFYKGENFGLPSMKSILGKRGAEEINNAVNLPSRENPSLAAYHINTTRINPASRNVNATSIFLNSIPTIELSRCVPYLDVNFQFLRPSTDVSGRPQTISITKFIEGANPLVGTGKAIHTAQPTNVESLSQKDEQGATISEISPGFASMELFTSPQTLVNADPDNSELARVSPVIDKFRPFMSIEEFEIQVVPTTGVMSYKTATLKLILHDRSRLSEIAEFIKPDMVGFNNVEMLIEYGWSHPDNSSPYGKFLNAMRKKEKYSIRNHKFEIRDNGEVSIELELYMKGALEFYNTTINEGGQVGKIQNQVADLQKRISDVRNRLFSKQSTFVKEIRGTQILNAASDVSSNLSLSRDLKKELRKNLASLANIPGDDAKELRELLKQLYGTRKEDGIASNLLKTVSEEFQERMKLISGKDERTPDPWIEGLPDRVEDFDLVNGKFKKSDYVSFGKLATLFIGQPLAASKKFDEVQLLFYPFNDGAGFAKDLNIASFSIEIDQFINKFSKIRDLKRTIDLSIRDFTQFITNSFFDDPASLDYGMRRFYTYERDKESGGKKARLRRRDGKGKRTDLSDEYSERIRESGVPNDTFKMAHLDVYVECVPAESFDANKNLNDHRSILRIHFFDRVATPYASLGSFLRAMRDEDIGTITRSNTKSNEDGTRGQNSSDHRKLANQIIEQAKSMNLIETDTNDGSGTSYRIIGGPRKIKQFASNTMPTIIFGTSTTAVISAGFKTMHEPRLSTVNMLRAGDASPLTPSGAGQGGVPLWVHPAQMDMEIFGCPIIEFMQNFFVDFQTNTTVDNMYNVVKLSHRIRAGEFNTSISLTPQDAYPSYRALSDKVAGAISILNKVVAEDPNDDLSDGNL